MKRHKNAWLGLAATLFVAAAILLDAHNAVPWQQVGDDRFQIQGVTSRDHQYDPWEPFHHEVIITLNIARSQAYTDAYRLANHIPASDIYAVPVDYPPSIIRHMNLVTPEGDRLPPLDEQQIINTFFWDDLTHRSHTSSQGMELVFDNPGHEHKATLTADVYEGHDPPNTEPCPQSWPKVGQVCFKDIRIP